MSKKEKAPTSAATLTGAGTETAAGQAAISMSDCTTGGAGRQPGFIKSLLSHGADQADRNGGRKGGGAAVTDVFAETRRLVSAREVAEMNGLHPNRAGFVCCPLHHEKTASLKLYENGSWHCFGCNRGGSSIDFAAALYDLTPLDAVRRLNDNFRLGLPLDKLPDKADQAAAQHRREVNDTYRLFVQWRDSLIQRLNACFREGHLAMKSLETPADLDRLTDAQALAIRQQAYVEYLADTLTTSTMEEQMEIFRERGQIGQLCHKILNNSSMKSGAA